VINPCNVAGGAYGDGGLYLRASAAGCRGVVIFERKQSVFDLADELHRGLEIRVCLFGEADDESPDITISGRAAPDAFDRADSFRRCGCGSSLEEYNRTRK